MKKGGRIEGKLGKQQIGGRHQGWKRERKWGRREDMNQNMRRTKKHSTDRNKES